MSKGREVHSTPVIANIDIRDKDRLADLSISTASAVRATDTVESDFYIVSDIDCYVRVSSVSSGDAATVTTSSGFFLPAHTHSEPFFVKSQHWIGIITETGTGTVQFLPVG